MTAEFWSTVLPWPTVVFSLLALFSTGASIVARDKVAAQKEAEIRKLKPRVLSDEHRAMLIEKLKGQHSKVGMVTPLMDGEARDYAEALGAAFKKSELSPLSARKRT